MSRTREDARRILRSVEDHKSRSGWDEEAVSEIVKALDRAFDEGRSAVDVDAKRQAARDHYGEAFDVAVTRRIGALIAAVGEQVTMPALLRAVQIAPAVDPPDDTRAHGWGPGGIQILEVPRWAQELADQLRAGSSAAAHEILKDLREQAQPKTSSPHRTSRGRSDTDLVVAFVAGALLF